MAEGEEAVSAAAESKSKEALADSLRELLGLKDVRFEKLSKTELQQLYTALSRLGSLAQIGVRGLRSRVQTQLLNKRLGEIINDKTLFGEKGLLPEEGLLGLGIIPSLRRIVTAAEADEKEGKTGSV